MNDMGTAPQYSEQDRERTEGELADGPVSRGVSKQGAPSNPLANSDPTTAAVSPGTGDNDEHYNKLANRDLGSVGGGSIPGGNTYGGMNTSNDTVGGGSPAAGAEGVSNDRDSTSIPGMNESPGAPAANGQSQQGTLGGRNPGQTQDQPIGDQDATFGHRDPGDDPLADPMTSRAPDKVNQRTKQDG